jgi:transposase-like protein
MNTAIFEHYDPTESSISASLNRCLRMIELHAPRLMRVAGGPLAQEEANPRTAIPAEVKRAAIAAYLDQGRPSHASIAKQFGLGESTVGQMLRAAGIRTGPGHHNHRDTKSRQGAKGFVARNPEALMAAALEFNATPPRYGALKAIACKYGLNDSSVYSKAKALRERGGNGQEHQHHAAAR